MVFTEINMKKAYHQKNRKKFVSEKGTSTSSKRKSPEDDSSDSEEEACASNSGLGHSKGKAVVSKLKSKKVKLSKAASNKNDAIEELAVLKESSLLKLQIKELLSEVMLKGKKKEEIDVFISKLKAVLLELHPGKKYELSDTKWLKKLKVRMPINVHPKHVKGKFQFHPPVQVNTIGSYPLGLATKPDPAVDLSVVMPKECFQAKDHLNQRYLRKRALYLAVIASHLKSYGFVDELSFTYHHGNHMKPILILKPSEAHGKGFLVHIHARPEEDTFKFSRFHIDKNNIRTLWFEGKEEKDTEEGTNAESEPATPHYNSWILQDMAQDSNQHHLQQALGESVTVREALCLLKVWLHQRKLDKGLGCFSSYVLTMFVAHLLLTNKLNAMMSCLQLLRNTLLYLSRADWSAKAISSSSAAGTSVPTTDDFGRVFEVVFVDKTGYVNICCDMYRATFESMVQEATLGVRNLENPIVDRFAALFSSPVKFLLSHDQCFQISNLMDCDEKLCDRSSLLSRCGNIQTLCVSGIVKLIRKALGNRVKLVAVQLQNPAKWPTSKPPTADATDKPLTLGVLLDPDHAYNILEKGPQAELSEAAAFREFWGEKSELRRFQDGSICEAVVWSATTFSDRRKIVGKIGKYILNRHADVPKTSVHVVCSQLDPLVTRSHSDKSLNSLNGTGEEQTQIVHRCFDDFAKQLRSLKDLPLAVHTIQGISPVFRHCEVFPPVPEKYFDVVKSEDMEICRPDPDRRCPPWTPALRVLCMMEASGKWPDDKHAIKRIKAAFLIQIAQLLRQTHGLTCQINPNFLDVLKGGFVFRVEVGYLKEISLLKLVKTSEGMVKTVETPEAAELQRKLVTLPQLTSILNGIHQQNNSFNVCVRLAKRWISAHMLLNGYLKEEAIELLVAYLYITTGIYVQSSSPLIYFLRFLNLLATFDWNTSPLIVNLNSQLNDEEIAEIQSHFTRERSSLPSMFIATPQDKKSSQLTRHSPTQQILQRLVMLARNTYRVLEEQLLEETSGADMKLAFRPPLDSYDVIIHLNARHLARHHHAIDVTKTTFMPQLQAEQELSKSGGYLPVVEYSPVECYLNELRETYDDIAWFFHDVYGGEIVAVLWKPSAFQNRPFKITQLHGRILSSSSTSEETQVVCSVDTVMEGFNVLGEGLVRNIEAKTENWKI